MRPRSNFRLAILLATLIGGFLLSGAQELPWTDPDPEVALNQLLGSTPLRWRILTEWKSEKETIQIVPGSEVICEGSDKVLFRGKHLWRGTYDEATGKLDVTRNLSAEERKQLEIEHEVPDWARRLVAKEPVREEMVLTVKGEADGSLSMTGDIYGEKIHWDEPENVDTGQPDPSKRTAEIMADSDKRRPLGFTFATPGLSQDARDALKQSLYLSQLFRQREELLNSQIPAQIASLQKTYDTLNTSSAGANEVRRLEEIGRTIDALRASWLSNLEKNKQKILETASQNPSHFNSGLRNILEKYVQVLNKTRQDPNNTLNRKILEDTEVRLLLYLGEGAEAVNWHDDLQKRAFLYAIIKAEADFAYPTAVTEASLVINAACANPPLRPASRPTETATEPTTKPSKSSAANEPATKSAPSNTSAKSTIVAAVGAEKHFASGISPAEGWRFAQDIRRSLGIENGRNVGFAKTNIGGRSELLPGVSGESSPPGTAAAPTDPLFTTRPSGAMTRAADSEVKILEHIAKDLPTDAEGTVYLYTERAACKGSCVDVIRQFKRRFPRIKMEVTWGGSPSDAGSVWRVPDLPPDD